MSNAIASAPKPEVVHLPTLFRRVENADIRIPSFQRKFVWESKSIVELLESVYRGYPVGSLLFWRTEPSELMFAPESFGRTIKATRTPVSFLLDGQQRLTSLYRCFFGDSSRPWYFNVSFDLSREQFYYAAEDTEPGRVPVSLSALFAPKEFLAVQQRLLELPNGEALADLAIRLHTRFQEYMIPTVTIEDREVSEVVEIFERINRTGTTLSAVDFMRAVTWSAGFDLKKEVDRLSSEAEAAGYSIPAETHVKLVAISLGKDPIPEEMLKLRGVKATDLHDAVKRTAAATAKAIAFLKKECAFHSYEYVPYEGQFLAVARAFQVRSKPAPAALKQVKAWLWSVSFNEDLRGTPDHVVASLVRAVDAVVTNKIKTLPTKVTLTEQDVTRRRFIKGKALSAGVAGLFADCRARSLVTGKPLDPELYMSSFDAGHYQPLLAREHLPEEVTAAKSLANTFLCSDTDFATIRKVGVVASLLKLEKKSKLAFDAALESQLIPKNAWEALRKNEGADFLSHRAKAILKAAKRVSTAS